MATLTLTPLSRSGIWKSGASIFAGIVSQPENAGVYHVIGSRKLNTRVVCKCTSSDQAACRGGCRDDLIPPHMHANSCSALLSFSVTDLSLIIFTTYFSYYTPFFHFQHFGLKLISAHTRHNSRAQITLHPYLARLAIKLPSTTAPAVANESQVHTTPTNKKQFLKRYSTTYSIETIHFPTCNILYIKRYLDPPKKRRLSPISQWTNHSVLRRLLFHHLPTLTFHNLLRLLLSTTPLKRQLYKTRACPGHQYSLHIHHHCRL